MLVSLVCESIDWTMVEVDSRLKQNSMISVQGGEVGSRTVKCEGESSVEGELCSQG